METEANAEVGIDNGFCCLAHCPAVSVRRERRH